METNADIIAAVLSYEGGFTNNRVDRGGATNWGITQATLTAWRKHPATAADVKALTKDEAVQIYTELYIVRPGFDKISDMRLRHLVVDSGVQHGQGRVTQWLQTLVKVPVDGALGPKTGAAINREDPQRLFNRLLARRIRFYGEIISGDRSQARFAKGWMSRAASFLEG